MAIRAGGYTPDPSRESVRFRSRREMGEEGGEFEQLKELFEGLMEDTEGEGEVEGLEGFDWESLWDSFMGEEESQDSYSYRQPTQSVGQPISWY